jgi:hypothetical protein
MAKHVLRWRRLSNIEESCCYYNEPSTHNKLKMGGPSAWGLSGANSHILKKKNSM